MNYIEQFKQDQAKIQESLDIPGKLAKSQIKLSAEIKPPPPVMQIDDGREYMTTIFTEGNISLMQGQAKARKSFAIGMIIAAAISQNMIYNKFQGRNKKRVFYFDTEQSSFYVQQNYHRIAEMANGDGIDKQLFVHCLRPYNPAERTELIDYVFSHVADIGFVVIDGIRDLISNINDPDESTAISSQLLKWSENTGAHIHCVLHENKGDMKARGHIGTELTNKAETIISVQKLQDDRDLSKIHCDRVRGLDFDDIYFRVVDNIPEIDKNYIEVNGEHSKYISEAFLSDLQTSNDEMAYRFVKMEKNVADSIYMRFQRILDGWVDFYGISQMTLDFLIENKGKFKRKITSREFVKYDLLINYKEPGSVEELKNLIKTEEIFTIKK